MHDSLHILEACSRPIVFPFQNLIPSLLPLANGVPVWPQIYRCGWWLPLLLFIRSWPQPHAHSIRKFLSLQRLHEYILRMLANPDMFGRLVARFLSLSKIVFIGSLNTDCSIHCNAAAMWDHKVADSSEGWIYNITNALFWSPTTRVDAVHQQWDDNYRFTWTISPKNVVL